MKNALKSVDSDKVTDTNKLAPCLWSTVYSTVDFHCFAGPINRTVQWMELVPAVPMLSASVKRSAMPFGSS